MVKIYSAPVVVILRLPTIEMQGATPGECIEHLMRYQLTDYEKWINSLYSIEPITVIGWILYIMDRDMSSAIEREDPIFVDDSKAIPHMDDNDGVVTIRPYFLNWRESVGFDDAGIVWNDRKTDQLVFISFFEVETSHLTDGETVTGKRVDRVVFFDQTPLGFVFALLCCKFPDQPLESIVELISKLSNDESWRLVRNLSFLYGQTREEYHDHVLRDSVIGFYYKDIASKWELLPKTNRSVLRKDYLQSMHNMGALDYNGTNDISWYGLGDDTPAMTAMDCSFRDGWYQCVSMIDMDVGLSVEILEIVTDAVDDHYGLAHNSRFADEIRRVYSPDQSALVVEHSLSDNQANSSTVTQAANKIPDGNADTIESPEPHPDESSSNNPSSTNGAALDDEPKTINSFDESDSPKPNDSRKEVSPKSDDRINAQEPNHVSIEPPIEDPKVRSVIDRLVELNVIHLVS